MIITLNTTNCYFDPKAVISGGDHWIVLRSIKNIDIKNNKITASLYDDHNGEYTTTFDYDSFKDMIYHVIKVEKNKKSKKNLQVVDEE